MRPLGALFLVAAAATAEPYVRWIDATGGYRRETVTEVLGESLTEVRVRLADGTVETIPGRSFLELVREREGVEEESDLYDARESVVWGTESEAARRTLDRILGRHLEGWIHEYASAHRAILAGELEEKDALPRLEAFLEAYPKSRWRPRVLYARAAVRALEAPNAAIAMKKFVDAVVEVREAGGPRLAEALGYIDVTRYMLRKFPQEGRFIVTTMQSTLSNVEQKREDMTSKICAASAREWIRLITLTLTRDEVIALGERPYGPAERMVKVREASGFLLPELASDVAREMGETLLHCERPEDALAQLRAALELAPDRRRKAMARSGVERAAAALERARASRRTPPGEGKIEKEKE
ncbi:MAG: hypothetical protein ACT4PV_14930 [Planctomycetaceae bacterium]